MPNMCAEQLQISAAILRKFSEKSSKIIKFDQSIKIEYDSKIEHISKEISQNILIKIN